MLARTPVEEHDLWFEPADPDEYGDDALVQGVYIVEEVAAQREAMIRLIIHHVRLSMVRRQP
jgi:hypothetical protein